MLRRLSDIVTRGGVRWNQMPADCFEKFVYPDFTFRVPASEEEYLRRLTEMFPAEEAALRAYFEDVRTMNGWFGRHNMKSPEPFVDRVRQKLQISGFETANITTADYFNKNFTDPKLRALLASQWGDYGIPPSKSPFRTALQRRLSLFSRGLLSRRRREHHRRKRKTDHRRARRPGTAFARSRRDSGRKRRSQGRSGSQSTCAAGEGRPGSLRIFRPGDHFERRRASDLQQVIARIGGNPLPPAAERIL